MTEKAGNRPEQLSIYILLDPRDGRARYVGITKKPKQRLKQHINEARHGIVQTPKNRWIRDILDNQQEPLLAVLWTMETARAKRKEILLIKGFAESGWLLTNTTGMPVPVPLPTREGSRWKRNWREIISVTLGQVAAKRGALLSD